MVVALGLGITRVVTLGQITPPLLPVLVPCSRSQVLASGRFLAEQWAACCDHG